VGSPRDGGIVTAENVFVHTLRRWRNCQLLRGASPSLPSQWPRSVPVMKITETTPTNIQSDEQGMRLMMGHRGRDRDTDRQLKHRKHTSSNSNNTQDNVTNKSELSMTLSLGNKDLPNALQSYVVK